MYFYWLIAYLTIIISVGYFFSKRVKDADDYALAGSSLGFFPICGTIMATATGSFAIIATSGRGFTTGLSFLTWNIGYVLFGILAAVLLASAIRSLKLYTIPELFKRRFGKWAALLPAITIGLMFLITLFAVQLVGMGSVMASTFGIKFEVGILIGFVVSVGFTLAGGMFSVAYTDALQMVIILFGVVLLFVLSAEQLGGVAQAFKNSTPEIVDPFSISFGDWLSLLLIFGTLSFVYQTTWQRIAAAKSKKIAVRAVSTGFGIVFIMTILTVCIGIFARQLIPTETKPDMVYSTLMTEIMPPKISGLFVVTLFSAILTSATSFLLSGATSIARDIYTEWINPSSTKESLLKILRLATAFMAIIGLGIAFFVKDIWTITLYAKAVSASILFFPVLAAFFWKQATTVGVITSMVIAALVAISWQALGNPFDTNAVIPGMTINFLTLVVVSLLTNHSTDEDPVAYYFKYRNQF